MTFAVRQAISKSVLKEWWTWQLLSFLGTSSKLIRKDRMHDTQINVIYLNMEYLSFTIT